MALELCKSIAFLNMIWKKLNLNLTASNFITCFKILSKIVGGAFPELNQCPIPSSSCSPEYHWMYPWRPAPSIIRWPKPWSNSAICLRKTSFASLRKHYSTKWDTLSYVHINSGIRFSCGQLLLKIAGMGNEIIANLMRQGFELHVEKLIRRYRYFLPFRRLVNIKKEQSSYFGVR